MRGPSGGGAGPTAPGFLLPFGHRPWLVGSSCARWGIEPSSRSAYRPKAGPDPNGVVVLPMSKLRPGRAPPLSRGRWCAPGRRLSSGRHLPLSCGQSLRPRWNNPSAGGTFTRRHRRFTAFTHHPGATGSRPGAGRLSGLPPVFSSPAAPGWNNGRFGFYLGLRTPQLPATHAKAETGHRALARVLRCLTTFAVSTAGRVGVVNGVCRGDLAGSRDAGRWTASPWP
jgi:hypothetical protein